MAPSATDRLGRLEGRHLDLSGRRALGSRFAALLVLIALLASAPIGCSNSSPADRPTPPGVAPTLEVATGPDTVRATYDIILARSVERADSRVLLDAALESATQSVRGAGVADPAVDPPAFVGDAEQDWQMFAPAIAKLATHYGAKVSSNKISLAAVRGMVAASGDCTAEYLPPTAAAAARAGNEPSKGTGTGVIVATLVGAEVPVVWRVFQESPAARAGLVPGDEIISIDGQPTTRLDLRNTELALAGPSGSVARLEVARSGLNGPLNLTLTRSSFEMPTVEAAALADGLGYLRVHDLGELGVVPFERAVRYLAGHETRGWVIDARNAAGTPVDLPRVLGPLVGPARLYVARDRQRTRTDAFGAGDRLTGLPPMVVLVNEGTRSGAELFAAALQENGALVIGARTTGCVGVTEAFDLPSGAALRVAVARIQTGRLRRELDRLGLLPDAEIPFSLAELAAGQDPQLEAARRRLQPASPSGELAKQRAD